jgi:hypothetical protein
MEKGEVIPPNETLKLIAKATNKPINWFNRTAQIEVNIGEIHFHKINWQKQG